MTAHQRFRPAAAVYVAAILLCLVSTCRCGTSLSENEPIHSPSMSEHDGAMEQEQIILGNSHEQNNRDGESVQDELLPQETIELPWHHKNDTDGGKNGKDDGDRGGGGDGGGHHWPWPWPHPTPTPLPGPPAPGPAPEPPAPSPDDDKNKTDTSCAAQTNCTSCAESSWGCHWCAYDEACHAKGSVHGCIAGVNCYRQDRCTRKVPEPIRGYDMGDVGKLPLLVILSLAGLIICCASCCFGVACCMRGTYEDYATLAVANNAGDSSVMMQSSQRPRTISFREEVTVSDGDNDVRDGTGANENERDGTEYQRLLDEGGSGVGAGEDEESLHTRITAARSQVMTNSSNTKCMFNACTVCYAATVFCVGVLAVMGIVYSPRRPDMNVCSDAVAWKSIVDGMTSFKAQASFQILMSVQNPNRFDVVLDMASGCFMHDGAQVGTFTVPRTSIQSMAITDLLVSVTFTPDKWEALQLTAEYYKGTLTFLVDMAAAVQIPALANFTYDFEVNNYKVLAADPKLQDRHLCYCPDKNGKVFVDSSLSVSTAAELFPIEYN